jgi:phosphatidylserine decarboxylase
MFNSSEYSVYVLKTKSIKIKPRMTFMEAVFATILFDLALFGTSNPVINGIIRFFTSLQNSWDSQFLSQEDAFTQVTEFCERLSIQQNPWIWEKSKEDYTSLNDFFSRTFLRSEFPTLGSANIVAPACCTMTRYNDDASMKSLLIKGCSYRIEEIGLPSEDTHLYRQNPIFIGYLSPTDYHRIHSPMAGKCTVCKMEGIDKTSASVKFFGAKFNILNENKRLVIVLDSGQDFKIALVVIGGIGVDSIVYNDMIGQQISKGQELAAFRAGGSAIAMFSTAPVKLTAEFEKASKGNAHVEVQVGESLAD